MSRAELDSLHRQIEELLREAARERASYHTDIDAGPAYWREQPTITGVEMAVISSLVTSPEPAEAIAELLARNLSATRHFLDALVAVGVLERRGELYQATRATEEYLRAFREAPPDYQG